MNSKKILKLLTFLFLFIFYIMSLLPIVFAEHLIVPTQIRKVFPDLAFATKIAYTLGKSSVHELVTQDELNGIENFEQILNQGIQYKISNISGVQYLNNLRRFSIMGGEISDLWPLSKLANLCTINLYHNQIVSLEPLSKLVNLTHLNLTWNLVTDLMPLSKLSNLIWIEVSENKITDLSPLKSLRNLNVLNAANNQIRTVRTLLDFEGVTSLFLEGNPIEDLSVLSSKFFVNLNRGCRRKVNNKPRCCVC
ncbi:MAG: hypothetical protein LBK29_00180 [Oscillospiraceae bacterium]|nr:hypothetical protein [Oscillospiraceae bacterium]